MITIGIIGGTGGMGKLFEKVFLKAGHKVLIAGRSTALTYSDLARKSDVVIISTPVSTVEAICKEVGPLLTKDQALMDFCSLKHGVVASMLAHTTEADVVGTHPMFGPFTESLDGQNIILCPGRGDTWLNWIHNEFSATGAVVTVIDTLTHDKTMAVAQGLTHLITISTGRLLQKMDMSPTKTENYSTPIFKLKNDLIGRLFAQDPDLYATLVGSNEFVHEVVDVFEASFKEARDILLSDNHENKVAYLKQIRTFLGDYCQKGLEASNKLLKSVV